MFGLLQKCLILSIATSLGSGALAAEKRRKKTTDTQTQEKELQDQINLVGDKKAEDEQKLEEEQKLEDAKRQEELKKQEMKKEEEARVEQEKEKEKEKEKEPSHKEENKKEVRAINKALDSKVVLSSGIGIIGAYKKFNKKALGSSGTVDIKLSYLTNITTKNEKKIYGTFRYSPFDINPNETTNNNNQEYSGIVSTYLFGAEFEHPFRKYLSFYNSIEAGFLQARLKELIPISESEPPVSKFGILFALGGEVRYMPYERFHIGLRTHFATGQISYASLLFNASFYF